MQKMASKLGLKRETLRKLAIKTGIRAGDGDAPPDTPSGGDHCNKKTGSNGAASAGGTLDGRDVRLGNTVNAPPKVNGLQP